MTALYLTALVVATLAIAVSFLPRTRSKTVARTTA